jgi:calcineurin-like phosphoesterase family protein
VIFFTSDTHYWHKRICELARRPWRTLEEMHTGLIASWNAKVGHDDTVYHLGDVSFAGRGHTLMILSQLKGKIVFLKGNHDKKANFWRTGVDTQTADRIHDLTYQGQRIVLCHYPLLTWDKAHRGAWHLHGHSHGKLDKRFNGSTTRIDVGVDAEHSCYAPLSFDQVADIMRRRRYEVVDQHGAHAA